MKILLDTAPKRSRLQPRRNPYWYGVAGGRGGVSLGYRRIATGSGAWIAKIVVEGRRIEERIGIADDDGSGEGAIAFGSAVAAALEWGKRQLAVVEATMLTGATVKTPTVRSAVEDYLSAFAKRSPAAATITRGRLAKHVLSDTAFASTTLSKLRASSIEDWRLKLPVRSSDESGGIGPSTVNRLLTDLRAALNATAERKRRELPAHLMLEIKVGTRRVAVETITSMQLLTDDEIRRLIGAAFEVDQDGDFGRLVLLAAATGARYSQLAKMLERDRRVLNRGGIHFLADF
ncbi:hypothetical protein [Methylopila sp. M107]|uniref:hypothetical protein n=1 Tax=Methylopila sp. M107 TaxID=1101190 RepID=UPI0012DFCA20|nr:hypothetical protein [Methylopila sp. M107]